MIIYFAKLKNISNLDPSKAFFTDTEGCSTFDGALAEAIHECKNKPQHWVMEPFSVYSMDDSNGSVSTVVMHEDIDAAIEQYEAEQQSEAERRYYDLGAVRENDWQADRENAL